MTTSFRVFDAHGVPRGSARGYTIEIPVAVRIDEWTTDGRLVSSGDMGTRTPPLPIMVPRTWAVDADLPVGVIVDVRYIEETDSQDGKTRRWLWCGGYLNEEDAVRMVGTPEHPLDWWPGADLDTEGPYESRPSGLAIMKWKLVGVTLHPSNEIAWDVPPVSIKRKDQE